MHGEDQAKRGVLLSAAIRDNSNRKTNPRLRPIRGSFYELATNVRFAPEDSDVPSQALNARLIALLLPCWLEGIGDGSCRGEGGT